MSLDWGVIEEESATDVDEVMVFPRPGAGLRVPGTVMR